jgi:hypothetical protein
LRNPLNTRAGIIAHRIEAQNPNPQNSQIVTELQLRPFLTHPLEVQPLNDDREIKTMEHKREKDLFGMLVVIGLGILVVLAMVLAWPGINIKVDYTTVPTVLAPLLLTAMFIERAVEVMISPWSDPGADERASMLKDARSDTVAIGSQHAAADEYTRYKGNTRRYAFTFALLLGTSAAVVGIRALWPFLDDPNGTFVAATTSTVNGITTISKAQGNPINDPIHHHPRTAFIVVDVVLSALLLAGGANGIHSVVTAFTSFFDKNTQTNQGVPS